MKLLQKTEKNISVSNRIIFNQKYLEVKWNSYQVKKNILYSSASVCSVYKNLNGRRMRCMECDEKNFGKREFESIMKWNFQRIALNWELKRKL